MRYKPFYFATGHYICLKKLSQAIILVYYIV